MSCSIRDLDRQFWCIEKKKQLNKKNMIVKITKEAGEKKNFAGM